MNRIHNFRMFNGILFAVFFVKLGYELRKIPNFPVNLGGSSFGSRWEHYPFLKNCSQQCEVRIYYHRFFFSTFYKHFLA